MQSVLLLTQHAPHGPRLRETLESRGYYIVDELRDPIGLHTEVVRLAPDVVVVCTDFLRDEMLSGLRTLSSTAPRPVVVFASDASRQAIRDAIDAGAAAYVVEGWAPERVTPIIEAACARFEAFVAVRKALTAAENRLEERKLVERAKGIVMQQRRLSEEHAYAALRKMAMDQNLTLAEISRRVIDVARLLA
jgi:two-component system, response regulator / RNA-binding antiterminator